MATNEFLLFGGLGTEGTNKLSLSNYNADNDRKYGNGFTTPLVRSQLVNKALEQTSKISSALAQFIVNHGVDALDSQTSGAIATNIDTAILALLSSYLTPTGAVQTFAMSSAPAGWLKANGAAVSRTAYANLFAAIGTTFGGGDGSTTFNLPDARGYFLRGYDDGRGIDSGRVFGSLQADDLKSHSHTIPINGSSGGNLTNVSEGDPSPADTTLATSSTGGTETRPKNIALLVCIKY